jgi:hypothetical protein
MYFGAPAVIRYIIGDNVARGLARSGYFRGYCYLQARQAIYL